MHRDDEDDRKISSLVNELQARAADNQALQKENQELRRELACLSSHLAALRHHPIEKNSTFWKKLQTPTNAGGGDGTPDASSPKPTAAVEEHTPATKNRNQKQVPPQTASCKTDGDGDAVAGRAAALPPPPPPVPAKLHARKALQRAPQVIELYHFLTKREAQIQGRRDPAGAGAAAYPRSMIGEIENRSAYLSAIKSAVETHRERISFLRREVESAACSEISGVEAFVKWLDEELSYLVDERAVLKHFPEWPERKADAMREAAFSYRDLKSLESEISSLKCSSGQPLIQFLRRVQALQDRLEQRVSSIEKNRESISKRYRALQIPWQWMLDTGLLGQMKLSSMKLVKEYMKRVNQELGSIECAAADREDLMIQGVRFAFRVHQFAGGFDAEAMNVFEELRKTAMAAAHDKQRHDLYANQRNSIEIG